MNTLVSVLGPTATGKTSFALKLAEQALSIESITGKNSGKKLFSGVDLISADSRQIYRGLEILSGADVPNEFKKVLPNKEDEQNIDAFMIDVFPYFENKNIRLHGVSIIGLNDEWSVAHFKNFAINIINNSFADNRLPIIVGGTTLYINHLFNKDNNLYVKPITEVRNKASQMTVQELQEWLRSVNPEKLVQMNNSDINNSRRLVRAIEISIGKPELEKIMNLPDDINNIKIGLTTDLEKISEKINKRVFERFNNVVVDEVKNLHSTCPTSSINSPNFSTSSTILGASDISSYLNNEIDQEKCLENWALHEFQYAKRQLMWLKKEKNIIWLDDSAKYSYTLSSKLFEKQNEKIYIQ
ncbi:hypothetical protein KKD03_05050 [Patescibacteria group bacterium]|nr:hypothetical protein [Patescibacteria group bacterium]